MSSSSRQRSIIRHPHDYTGATVEARTEGTGPNRQSITVEYAYATPNHGATTPNQSSRDRAQRASYAASRSTPPRAGSPTDRPPRVRNSLYKNPPAGSRKLSKEQPGYLQEQQPPSQPVYEEPEEVTSPMQAQTYTAPLRPSRANTETLQDLYTPDVAAFSESTNTNTVYDRRASLPALPTEEDSAFVADMNEALPPTTDPFGPGGHRSRSGTTTQGKPKKGGMLSFMSGTCTHHDDHDPQSIPVFPSILILAVYGFFH